MKEKNILQLDTLHILLLVFNTNYICISYYGLKCQNIRGRNSLVSNLLRFVRQPFLSRDFCMQSIGKNDGKQKHESFL